MYTEDCTRFKTSFPKFKEIIVYFIPQETKKLSCCVITTCCWIEISNLQCQQCAVYELGVFCNPCTISTVSPLLKTNSSLCCPQGS